MLAAGHIALLCTVALAYGMRLKADKIGEQAGNASVDTKSISTKPEELAMGPKPFLMAHYMLWFQKNGYHWVADPPKTANEDDPDFFKRARDGCDNDYNLPTWFPPVDGPFISNDKAHIRSDLTLMQEHRIDGLIFDYQQPCHEPERAFIKNALLTTVDVIETEFSSMKFAIMYDLASACDGAWDYDGRVKDWHEVISWAKQSPNYVSVDGKKLIFAFGATPMPSSADAASCPECVFYAQEGRHDTGIDGINWEQQGAFAWVSPKGGTSQAQPTTPGHMQSKLHQFYGKTCKHFALGGKTVPCVGAAFPGFAGIYLNHGYIPRSTRLLDATLWQCWRAGVKVCQLPTWNDYNEGTHIQPSHWCQSKGPSNDCSYPELWDSSECRPESFIETVKHWVDYA